MSRYTDNNKIISGVKMFKIHHISCRFLLISCGAEMEVEVSTNGGEPSGSHDSAEWQIEPIQPPHLTLVILLP